MYNSENRHPDISKITKILEWPFSSNIITARTFISVCVYFKIWIEYFILIVIPIYILFKKGVEFRWEQPQIDIITQLQTTLTTAPPLVTIIYNLESGEIIIAVDSSFGGWDVVFM